jgi:hypothetical protein
MAMDWVAYCRDMTWITKPMAYMDIDDKDIN